MNIGGLPVWEWSLVVAAIVAASRGASTFPGASAAERPSETSEADGNDSGITIAPGHGRDAEGDDEDGVQPDLVAVHRSMATGAVAMLTRIEFKPTFTLGRSSLHPRLAPGLFEVTWDGTLKPMDGDSVRIGPYLDGALEVTLDEAVILDGSGQAETSWFEPSKFRSLPHGEHRPRIVY